MKGKLTRASIIKTVIFIILVILFSGFELIESNHLVLSYFRLINSGLFAYMLVEIFSSIFKDEDKKKFHSKKFLIINLLWGITFIIVNYLRYGTVIKMLSILGLFVVIISLWGLFFEKDKPKKKEMDVYKFGYLWLLQVILIPFLVILVLKGY